MADLQQLEEKARPTHGGSVSSACGYFEAVRYANRGSQQPTNETMSETIILPPSIAFPRLWASGLISIKTSGIDHLTPRALPAQNSYDVPKVEWDRPFRKRRRDMTPEQKKEARRLRMMLYQRKKRGHPPLDAPVANRNKPIRKGYVNRDAGTQYGETGNA